jgi:hypothetical protein
MLTSRLLALALSVAALTTITAPARADHHEAAPAAATTPAGKGLEMLKSLAGRWVGTMGEGEKAMPAELVYQVTAGGSAVMVREFPGSPHEMVTLYHLDGDALRLTHYCAAGNQPTMVAREIGDGRLVFDFVSGTNMDPDTDGYMGRAEITLLPDGRLREAWTFFQGREAGDAHVIVASRADG